MKWTDFDNAAEAHAYKDLARLFDKGRRLTVLVMYINLVVLGGFLIWHLFQ